MNPRMSSADVDTAVTSAIARLSVEFAGRIRTGLVARTVLVACKDLDGSPRPALPELVERLARQRLLSGGVDGAGRS